ncbi:hypothetical protein MTO96_026934 [Rhipicephalus appendiculatus]
MLPPARDIPRQEHAVDTRPDERRNAERGTPYRGAVRSSRRGFRGPCYQCYSASVANRGTSLANAAARRVGSIRAVRETDGAADEQHRTPRGDQ